LTDLSTITFTGTGFYTSGYTALSSYSGIDADTVTVVSANEVKAVWNLGVPVQAADTKPLLSFKKDADTILFASHSETAILKNALSLTGSSTGLTCSFAGGCLYELQAAGLSSLLKNNKNENFI
jgi:hypothetical protein